jgi:hypothetical protein
VTASVYLTVPSKEALAILAPKLKKRHQLIGLVCPKNASFNNNKLNVK